VTTGTAVPATPTAAATQTAGEFPCTQTYETIIRGDEINGSGVQVVFDQAGLPQVAFALKGDGPSKFADFTSTHINQYMPILLDKRVISSPVIQGAITGGNGVINNIALADAQRLAVQLKYGALPVSLTLQSERKISATLGQDAIEKSILAGTIGLGLVILFMIAYYRLPGVLASVALMIYAMITYSIFKLVPVTLTLAGIAGFILSIGMAVDANVLIFSRLKEELRSGKTLGAAVEAGFDHAWPSIRDSNVSTLITCAILFWFGSTFGGASIIKGFALTLAVGVAVSMFTAITVTRTFLRAIVNTRLADNKWAFDLETAKPVAQGPGTREQGSAG
jgi:preprotein translocase subunit SecD